MNNPQLIAASVVSQVLAGSSLTAVLQTCWQKNSTLSSQQKGAIQDFSYGALRFYGQLAEILAKLLNKPLQNKKLYCLLLIGLYQLIYSKLPVYTTVNQTVSASRILINDKKIQGLVNAVLRNFIRQKDAILANAAKKETGLYSHPQWWINKLRKQYPQHFHGILKANNKRPPMTLRVNQRKISISAYQQMLSEHDMAAMLLWPKAISLKKAVSVDQLPGFYDGLVSVQDAGAQLAAPLLDVHQGMRVLDACAAPGGKSTHLLELADISLTILDNDESRLAQVRQNLERLQMNAAHLICADATNPILWWDGQSFDRILADVPCSSSGVVCRHPDIKWLRRESDLQQLTTHQQKILQSLWQILAKNGKLLYATCSIFSEENSLQMKRFVEQHPDARILPIHESTMHGGQLLPCAQHDGFFYTLLHKL